MKKTKILLSTLLLILSLAAASQKKSLYFDILQNGKKVGRMNFQEASSGKIDSLKMESTVNSKLIWAITSEAREMAVFSDGVLQESSIYRKLNGNEKANKRHRAVNGKYIITHGTNSKETKTYPITYNMLSLYSNEPVDISKVYSDNFESTLDIEKIEDHKYKVTLPDNNYNYYLYKDGVLNQVEIHHTLYSAKLVLVTKGR
jgi:hypothetical protein